MKILESLGRWRHVRSCWTPAGKVIKLFFLGHFQYGKVRRVFYGCNYNLLFRKWVGLSLSVTSSLVIDSVKISGLLQEVNNYDRKKFYNRILYVSNYDPLWQQTGFVSVIIMTCSVKIRGLPQEDNNYDHKKIFLFWVQ